MSWAWYDDLDPEYLEQKRKEAEAEADRLSEKSDNEQDENE